MKGMLTLVAGGSVGFLLGSMAGRDPYNRVHRLTTEGWRALPRDESGRLIVHPKAMVNAGANAMGETVDTSPNAQPSGSGSTTGPNSSRTESAASTGFEQFPASGLLG